MTKTLTPDDKAHGFDTIVLNAFNQKMSDAEFRQFILHTWGDRFKAERHGQGLPFGEDARVGSLKVPLSSL